MINIFFFLSSLEDGSMDNNVFISQVRSISEKFGLNLNAQIVCLSPSQWLNCFLEMLEVVPEKFHPS